MRTLVLHDRQTFDTFLTGASNELAHSAARAVAASPGATYNPVFVHGPSGVGKSHLLAAIAEEITRNRPATRVVAVPVEGAISDFVTAIRAHAMPIFRQKYRACDVLLIDDLQFLGRQHEKTQDELFHVFNALHAARKQIVLTADVPPPRMAGIEARLRSRFEWGLTVDVQPPDVELRARIARDKAARRGIALTDESIAAVAAACKTARQIEGALASVCAHQRLRGGPVDQAAIESALAIRGTGVRVTIDMVQREVAEQLGLQVRDLIGKRRDTSAARARQIAIYLCRKLTRVSSVELGRSFGGRDHSTILHAERKIALGLAADAELKGTVEALRRGLGAAE